MCTKQTDHVNKLQKKEESNKSLICIKTFEIISNSLLIAHVILWRNLYVLFVCNSLSVISVMFAVSAITVLSGLHVTLTVNMKNFIIFTLVISVSGQAEENTRPIIGRGCQSRM